MNELRNTRGFSLLEAMVAMTIVAMVFTVVFRGISVSLNTLTRVEESDRRLEFVRSKLAELDLCAAFRSGDHAEGQFDDGSRWKVDVSDFIPRTETIPASLVRLVLTVEWQGRSGLQHREITTYRYVLHLPNQPIPALEDQLRELR